MPIPGQNYQNIVQYLQALYQDAPFYNRHNITHPVVFYPAPSSQITDIDSITGHLSESPLMRDDLLIYSYAHLHTLQNTQRTMYDGVTFALKQVRTRPLRIDAMTGSYFDMIATCQALNQEIIDSSDHVFMRLPLRAQYHRSVDPLNAITRGRGRSAAIGGAVLIVFRHSSGYQAILAQRSASNATDPGSYHLLPAFIFQPQTTDVKACEWQFSYHVYRELLEELFGVSEIQSDDNHSEQVMQHPAIQYLQQLMQSNQAGLYLTGVSVNLLTLRPEICALLLIHDAGWYERISTPGSDIAMDTTAETLNGLTLVPAENDAAVQAMIPDSHLTIPPQAIPALWEGLDLARRLWQNRDKSPGVE